MQLKQAKQSTNSFLLDKEGDLRWGRLTVIVMLGVTIIFVFGGAIPSKIAVPQTAGEFGDSFGFVNAFFSAMAFAGVIVTLMMQRMELKYQREEMRKSANAQSEIARLSFISAYLTCLEAVRRELDFTRQGGEGGELDLELLSDLTFNLRGQFIQAAYEITPIRKLVSVLFVEVGACFNKLGEMTGIENFSSDQESVTMEIDSEKYSDEVLAPRMKIIQVLKTLHLSQIIDKPQIIGDIQISPKVMNSLLSNGEKFIEAFDGENVDFRMLLDYGQKLIEMGDELMGEIRSSIFD